MSVAGSVIATTVVLVVVGSEAITVAVAAVVGVVAVALATPALEVRSLRGDGND